MPVCCEDEMHGHFARLRCAVVLDRGGCISQPTTFRVRLRKGQSARLPVAGYIRRMAGQTGFETAILLKRMRRAWMAVLRARQRQRGVGQTTAKSEDVATRGGQFPRAREGSLSIASERIANSITLAPSRQARPASVVSRARAREHIFLPSPATPASLSRSTTTQH
jgi:hypothetical protein